MNKKVLSTAKRNLDKAKAPAKPKDIIYDPMGQWKFPGQPTRIPSGDITMAGVPFPVYGVDNTGYGQMMYPDNDYQFPGDVVDEFPQVAKKGGTKNSRKYSRSLTATNRLFVKNFLHKKHKHKIFDPNAPFYQDGGESDDYIYLDNLSPNDIEEYAKGGYIIEDVSIPSLTKAQKGGIFGRRKRKKEQEAQQQQLEYRAPVEVDNELYESVTPFAEAPEDFKQGVGNIKEVGVAAKAPEWLNFSREYEEKNSKQAFIDKKKRDFLKNTNKGLNRAYGISMENFPEQVESNFANEYDYKKNSYIMKKLSKKKSFNLNRRGEWVSDLSKKEKDILADSKYESKLQPSIWARTNAGLRTLYDQIKGKQYSNFGNRETYEGMTAKESKDIQDQGLMGALNTFSLLEAPGYGIANLINETGNLSYGSGYRKAPDFWSGEGELMSGVDHLKAAVVNPFIVMAPYDIASLAGAGASGISNLVNTTRAKIISNVANEVSSVQPLQKFIGNTGALADDAQIEILKARLPKSEAAKYSVKNFDDAKQLSNLHDTEYILPKDMVQSLERVSVEDLAKLQEEYKQINTPYLLRGYKPVEASRQLHDNYLTPLEAAKARAERMLAQESKWRVNDNAYVKDKFENIDNNFEELYANELGKNPSTLGVNTGGTAVIFKDNGLSSANQARIAAHETGHFYRNMADEANEWNSLFDFSKLNNRTARYLRGKSSARPNVETEDEGFNVEGFDFKKGPPHGDEIRERAAQLKDYIAQKNNIPLNKDFEITQSQLNDAIKNYVKDTGLDNSMTPFLNSIKDKKGLLKMMNKSALGLVPISLGVASQMQGQESNAGYAKGGMFQSFHKKK